MAGAAVFSEFAFVRIVFQVTCAAIGGCGFEIGGVRYRKKKLDETTLRSLESLLKTESLEKPKAGL